MIYGSETPRIYTPPKRELTPETTHGFAAIAFAEMMMGLKLFPWQEWLLKHALELNEDGTYRFRFIIILVGRQNGKSLVLLILALWHLFSVGSKTVIGTAQGLDRSEAAWKEAVEWVEDDEELNELVLNINRGHPKVLEVGGDNDDAMPWRREYRVAPASRKGGRGFSGDIILLDELREHQNWDSWSAVTNDLANTTPILKADGTWSTISALSAGDVIFAPNGEPTTVLDIHPVEELRPMYRVTSSDGRSIIASATHLWTVCNRGEWQVLSTEQMLNSGLRRKAGAQNPWRFTLPHQEALADLPERDLPIHPYILGAWLGDGHSREGTITVAASDLDEMIAALRGARARLLSKAETHPGVWRLSVHDGSGSLRSRLIDMNVYRNKHVPAAYETASATQRLALLQGLLDTDGCVPRPRAARFTSKDEHLADSVAFLARSLGWTAWKSQIRATGGGCVQRRDYGPHWQVQFNVPVGDPVPFRLPRKVAHFGSDRTGMRPRLHTSIVAIEPVETEPSTCIEVDSKDHLFLAGRDLMATHNTMNARPKGQAWAFSNAGDALSIVLRFLRAQVHQRLGWPDGDGDAEILGEVDPEMEAFLDDIGAADMTALFEWSAPPTAKRNDIEAWAQANPSMNHTEIVPNCVTDRAVAAALATNPPYEFETEVLCRWVAMSDAGPFPEGSWEETLSFDARPTDDSKQIVCVSVSQSRSMAYIARAGWDENHQPVVGIAAFSAGTDWVTQWLIDNKDAYEGVVVQDKGAPVASLMPEFEDARLPVIKWPATDVAVATGIMFDHLQKKTIRHLPHDRLDAAATSAAVKILSRAAFEIDMVKSPTDPAALQAAIGAVWALEAVDKIVPEICEWPDDDEIRAWLEEDIDY